MTWILATMIVFLCINILDSNPDSTALNLVGATFESVIIGKDKFVIFGPLLIVLCCFDVFLAHNFYIVGKTKDMQVRMICGTSCLQMEKYLLYQTVLLALASVPVGIIFTACITPLINLFFPYLTEGAYLISLSFDGLLESASVTILLLIYICIIDVGFVYQNSSGLVPSRGSEAGGEKIHTIMIGDPNSCFKKYFWAFLLCFSVILIYLDYKAILIWTAFGMYSLIKCNELVFPILFKKWIKSHENNIIDTAVSGFIRRDMHAVELDMIVFVISTVTFIVIYVSSQSNAAVLLTSLIAYILISLLQAMMIMFRFSIELSNRNLQFELLSYIGMDPSQERKIKEKEITGFYILAFVTVMLYAVSYLICAAIAGQIGVSIILTLICVIVCALGLCIFINIKGVQNENGSYFVKQISLSD